MKMRRLKPVTLKVKNIGRDGRKKTVEIPLKVDSLRGKELSDSSQGKIENAATSSQDQNVPLDDPSALAESRTPHEKRVLSAADNWEKIRENLLMAYIEEQQFPENVQCVNCIYAFASTRCEYCGTHHYFCLRCASALPANRNKFHVLIKSVRTPGY